ncbi:MAG: endo alpha-1,4 polygalactosaminidase [Acidobacteriaceae bacterium]
MRSILKAMACMILGFVCIGLGFAQAGSGEPTPSVLTPQLVATLPAPVPCDATKGSCWKPTIGMDWQWQLSCDTAKTCTNLDVKVPFYVIDAVGNPASTVAAIHKRGEHAYCYVDIGSWEETRSDASKFPESVLGKRYVGWPHERWLDIRQLGILAPIMIARMQVCVEKGFDGVEFDNVQDWDNPTGIAITRQESAYYTAWMANQAHTMGLSASWENAPTNVAVLEPYMEALIFESCYHYHFCEKSAPMVQAGKWVGGVEYKAEFQDMRFCPTYAKDQMVGAFKKLKLNSWRIACGAAK